MRIAHFSDLHLLSLDGAKVLDFANKRWIGGLNLLASRGRHYHTEVFEAMVADINASEIDHCVCTGDVTNLALEQEFVFARERFDGFDLGPGGVTVLPGNHDAYVRKGAQMFTGYFSDYFEPDPAWSWEDGSAWPSVRVRGSVAIIGLSTSLATPWFTAYGVVGDTQLDRLEQVLADPRLADCFRIVAIHHPPAGPPSRSRIRGLRDRHRFARVLADGGAELVLHGHEHRDLLHTLPGSDGQIPVRGIQSGTYEAGRPDRRARYRVFDIDDAAGRAAVPRLTMRVWDPTRREWVAEDEASAAVA